MICNQIAFLTLKEPYHTVIHFLLDTGSKNITEICQKADLSDGEAKQALKALMTIGLIEAEFYTWKSERRILFNVSGSTISKYPRKLLDPDEIV